MAIWRVLRAVATEGHFLVAIITMLVTWIVVELSNEPEPADCGSCPVQRERVLVEVAPDCTVLNGDPCEAVVDRCGLSNACQHTDFLSEICENDGCFYPEYRDLGPPEHRWDFR